MGALHEWLTDGITLEKSEAILAEYEREGWELVSLSWDSEGGCFMGCWKRPRSLKPKESASEAGMLDGASEWTKAWRIIIDALKEIGVPNVDHNARAIIARLAAQNMLIVGVDNVKD